MAKDKDDITEIINDLMWIMRNKAIEESTLEDPFALLHNPTFRKISSLLLEKVDPKWELEAIARAFLKEQLTWEEYEELREVCNIISLFNDTKVSTFLLQGARFAAERYINAEVCPIYLHRAQKNLAPEDLISQALADRIQELEKEKNTVVGFFSSSVKEYKISQLKALKNEFMHNIAELESYFKDALQDKKLIEGKDSRTAKILRYCLHLAGIIEADVKHANEKEEQSPGLGFRQ